MYKLIIAIIFCCCYGTAQTWDYSDFAAYQETLSRQQIADKISRYLQKQSQIADHYSLDDHCFKIYANKEDKLAGRTEYELRLGNNGQLNDRQRFIANDAQRPLTGLRIAIDPGHIGGPLLSRIEGRYVDMHPDKVGGRTDVRFHEGQLSVLTALHLRQLLEEQGATVFLTKDKAGEAVYSSDFFTWLRRDFLAAVEERVASESDSKRRAASRCWWLTRAPLSTIFRSLYNPMDLEARAQKINRFAPHLTLIIHYNAGGGNDENGQNTGTSENYSLAFVPGSFMNGELLDRRGRYEFVRLVVSDDIRESIAISRQVVVEFTRQLGTPVVEKVASPGYLSRSCLATDAPGVYARNLTLTRLVRGPICYGESLCQENYEESLRLAKRDVKIAGIETSPRVVAVAQAYFNAVMHVYGEKK